MTTLFDPIRIRGLEIPNRVWMSPMCTYTADPQPGEAGMPTDFHYAHYASRAAGGLGLVMVEASGVVPEGRISPYDLGIWDDGQVSDFARIVRGIRDGGAVAGIQLAHAGRKASSPRPWAGADPAGREGSAGAEDLEWLPVSPSAIAFPGSPVPHELTRTEIAETVQAFAEAARRAEAAGFDVVEIHAAHGYLLHSFLSPIANERTDEYGGSLENRARIVLEVIDAVRAAWPADKPVFLRVSTTDWVEENADDPPAGVDPPPDRGARQVGGGAGRRSHRLLLGRHRRGADPPRRGVPDPQCGRCPGREPHPHRGRRPHQLPGAGQCAHRPREGRRGLPQAPAAAQPLLGERRRSRTRRQPPLPRAVRVHALTVHGLAPALHSSLQHCIPHL